MVISYLLRRFSIDLLFTEHLLCLLLKNNAKIITDSNYWGNNSSGTEVKLSNLLAVQPVPLNLRKDTAGAFFKLNFCLIVITHF
jgi:hypothetical protein